MHPLNQAYQRIRTLIGNDCEDLESVQLVEAYRRYMRPSRVRVLLLAESHVFTSANDRSISIPTITELPGYPTQYARFVYCLGYGERNLTCHAFHPSRDGTPQFWKIFYSCVHRVSSSTDFEPILGKTTHKQRLRNKVRLLAELKANGIWLVDTSIVALYRAGVKIPNMHRALRESWDSYTRDIVASSGAEHVICIGKGVASVVGSDLRDLFGDRVATIQQPNAHLASAEHMDNYKRYGSICIR